MEENAARACNGTKLLGTSASSNVLPAVDVRMCVDADDRPDDDDVC